MDIKYNIEGIGYRGKVENRFFYIRGWCFEKSGKEYNLIARVNEDYVEPAIAWNNREDVEKTYPESAKTKNLGFDVRIPVSKDINIATLNKVELLAVVGKEQKVIYTFSNANIEKLITDFNKKNKKIYYKLDRADIREGYVTLSGWALSLYHDEQVNLYFTDSNGEDVKAKFVEIDRKDVVNALSPNNKNYKCGFNIIFKYDESKKYVLGLKSKNNYEIVDIDVEKLVKKTKFRDAHKLNLVDMAKRFTFKRAAKGIKILFTEGPSSFYKKLTENVVNNTAIEYGKWIKKNFVTEEELDVQRNHKFDFNPLISIAIPLYKTDHGFLKELIDSIMEQSYSNLELCLADASPSDELKAFIQEEYPEETRIKYKKLDKNIGISENTNEALWMCTGDYIMFSDHDDVLCKNALYEIVSALNEDRSIDAIYTDEDKTDFKGKKFFEPHFKPDFSIDLLTDVNYICHIFMVSRELADKVSETVDGKKMYLRGEYNGAQDYDFVLRSVEQANKIHHIPEILYHWRCHEASTAANPKSKMYAFEAGKKAIEAHYERVGINAKVELTKNLGIYRSHIEIAGNPLVSIIIPNKDHTDDLDKCLKSVFKKTTYDNYEIIIVENNSELDETFKYYEKIQKEHSNVKVVFWKDKFNYAAINNFGAGFCKGDYYILLNNDVEVIAKNWIQEMLGYCQREDVGIAGALLFYPDDTIQHAGVILGFGGIAGHAAIGQSRYELGYMARPFETQDMSAVTAACLMVDAKVFKEVEGLDETFEVAFNDVDFCMKVRKAGYLIVYTPYCQLYHYESKSRGYEDTPEKVERFNGEIAKFKAKWSKELEAGDPFYNKNLSLIRADYSIRGEDEILA